MSVRLFGIHGFKRSGKDTVARMISSRIQKVEGYVCCITHYADRLKAAASSLFDLGPKFFQLDELKEQQVPGLCCETTPRKIMTDIHDGLVPLFGKDLFVHPVKADWKRWTGRGAFIVADVRYEGSETDWIRDAGGVVVHVLRPGVGPSGHSSEQGVPIKDGDFVIENSGSLEDLERSVADLLIDTRGHFSVANS